MTLWYAILRKLLAVFLGNGPGPLIGYNRGGMAVEILFSPGRTPFGLGSPSVVWRVARVVIASMTARRARLPGAWAGGGSVRGGRTGERPRGGGEADGPDGRTTAAARRVRVRAAPARGSDRAAQARTGRAADGRAVDVLSRRTTVAPSCAPARARVIGPNLTRRGRPLR